MQCVMAFAVAMASVMGNRLCLNIRSVAQSSDEEGTKMRNVLSALKFCHTFSSSTTTQDENQDEQDIEVGRQ